MSSPIPQRGQRGTVQSIERALEIVDSLAASGGSATLQTMATDTGLPLATLHRICGTLADSGYLRRGPGREYLLGPRLHRAGLVAAGATAGWATSILTRIVEETGETANLVVRERDGVVYLAQVPSPHSMRMFTEVGRRVEIHCTAVGKVLAADLPDEEIRAVLARSGMRRETEHTITNEAAYLAEIDTVRRVGYATDESEQEEGVRCVAVREGSGPSAVAFSVSGPEARFTPERRDAAVEVMLEALRTMPGRR